MSEELGKKADYGEELKRVTPQAQSIAAGGNVEAACELLLSLEKQARLANDIATLKSVVVLILQLCAQYKRWELLNDHITLLSKRRAQKASAVTVVVAKAMEFLPETPSESVKMELIQVLRQVAEGKIFLEKERAILTKMLSHMKEARGEIDEAATILQEVHVETYGAMTKLEKAEYILEQVRLTLAKKDYVRANILAKKILKRTLEEDAFQDVKLKYYFLMNEYETHENRTLELCRNWMAIFNTNKVQDDESMWIEALQHAALFVILSPFCNLQSDLLHTLAREKKIEKLPVYQQLLTKFTTKEIIGYPLPQDEIIRKHAIFHNMERGQDWWSTMRTRVTEHNIRVVAEHYERVRLPHLANMIGLDEKTTEESISTLVSNGSIYAKIDRPAKLVCFQRPLSPEEQLSNWSADISQLLRLVETTCHLISKENMIHKI